MGNSIEGTMFASVPAWPVAIRDVSVEEARKISDDIGAHVDAVRAAVSLGHIVASDETLVALARHVVGPEEAERLRLEIEALEHDATPSDIMAEHDATPSEKGKV